MSSFDEFKQLSLQLPLQAAQAREDLVVSDVNRHAVEFMDAWPDWPGAIAILAGPVGAGKTHLAQIWASRANAHFLDLSLDPEPTEVLPGANFVVEDIVQGAFNESWLFHLFNAVRASKGHLLLTSRRWPGEWGVALPDLQSRVKSAHMMELQEPDDALLRGVLSKLFADRQLLVEPSVIDYLVLRMERSLASAQALVERLDQLSLSEKRAITRPLAADVLSNLGL